MLSMKVNDQYPFEFETVRVDERGQVIERQQGRAFAFRESLADEIELEMVAIPGGTFMMGSPESEPDRTELENFQHQVTVQPFFMGKYPVTQEQWQAIVNTTAIERGLPTNLWFEGDRLPITSVSWFEAVEFCQRLSRETGRQYRLPTEAEWEYTCRAGTETPFYFGKTITADLANYRGTFFGDPQPRLSGSYDRGPTGIYLEDTTPVDKFPPNAFGLYDMHGNVSEWCLDYFHGDYEGAPTDGSVWADGGDHTIRVLRGGSFDDFPCGCRSADRSLNEPDDHYCTIGFRVVCDMPRTP